jgi:hypothetical protein
MKHCQAMLWEVSRTRRDTKGEVKVMRTKRALALAMMLGALGVGAATSAAQEPGRMAQQQQQQQMMQMQQQFMHLNQAMERVSFVQQRAHVMEREMARSMERIHQNQELAARNTEQLRNQERLRSMAQSMDDGAQQTHRAMEQLRNMLGDPAVAGDGDMVREMERLRQHWEEIAGQMEEGLQIMDRLHDRLQIHQSN